MKYLVTGTQQMIQIVSLPETGDNMVLPHASQFRGTVYSVSKILSKMQEIKKRIKEVEKNFHTDRSARECFELGESFFVPDDIPLVFVVQRSRVTIYGAGQVLAKDIANIDAFIKSCQAFILENE